MLQKRAHRWAVPAGRKGGEGMLLKGKKCSTTVKHQYSRAERGNQIVVGKKGASKGRTRAGSVAKRRKASFHSRSPKSETKCRCRSR